MKSKSIIIAVLLFTVINSFGQKIPVEVLYSNKDYRYQHFFSKELKPASSFGFFHTASIYHYFDKELETEVMNQSYLTFKISKSFTILGGTFYASIPGFKASTSLQYKYAHNDFFLLLAPRIDLNKNLSHEIFGLMEYRPALTTRVNVYTRLQWMSNYTRDVHNRSYQNLRIGLGNKSTQGGFAMNHDQYGPEVHKVLSLGFFLRYELGS